jgi:hypothetical protein
VWNPPINSSRNLLNLEHGTFINKAPSFSTDKPEPSKSTRSYQESITLKYFFPLSSESRPCPAQTVTSSFFQHSQKEAEA